MTSVDNILTRARAAVAITSLPDDDKRGAEAYFQAYEYVAGGNPGESPATLRELASQYLDLTATPSLTEAQEQAAQLASETLGQLQS